MIKKIMQRTIKQVNTLVLLTGMFFSVVTLFPAAARASGMQQNPVQLLQYIADNMISGLRSNKATLKNNPGKVYQLAYRYVVPYADIAEMSRRVIPPQVWNNASGQERAQFEKKFTRLLIRTYASALTSYQDQEVRFFPVRGNVGAMSTVEVNSEIVSSSAQPIKVTYRLLKAGSVWRLYDMSVEGVSLIESFRSQFADILAEGNMSKLLNQLDRHNTAKRST